MSTASTPPSTSMDVDWSPTMTTTTSSSSRISVPFPFHSVRRIGSWPQSSSTDMSTTTTSNPAYAVGRAGAAPYFPTEDMLVDDTNLSTLACCRRLDPRPRGVSHTAEDSSDPINNDCQFSTPRWGFSNVIVPQDANPLDREGDDCSRRRTTTTKTSHHPESLSTTTAEAELSCIAQQDTNDSSHFFCIRTNDIMLSDTESTHLPAALLPTMKTSRLPLLDFDTNDDEDNEHDSDGGDDHSRSRPRILPMRRTNTKLPLPWLAND